MPSRQGIPADGSETGRLRAPGFFVWLDSKFAINTQELEGASKRNCPSDCRRLVGSPSETIEWIQAGEFPAAILGGETPVDWPSLAVALLDVGLNLPSQGLFVRDASGQTGVRKDLQLDFGNVESTPMFGA